MIRIVLAMSLTALFSSAPIAESGSIYVSDKRLAAASSTGVLPCRLSVDAQFDEHVLLK